MTGKHAATPPVQGGPWTSHGHPVAGVTVNGPGRPPVARCGGPAICRVCARDAEQIRARTVVTRAVGDVPILERRLLDPTGQPLDLRAQAEAGTAEGYACVWDVVDSYGTTFAPRCFSAGGLDGGDYALLWMHDPASPIGVFRAAEDDHGLLIRLKWDKTAGGEDARQRAISGSAPGLSVGFRPLMVDPDDTNRFTQAGLVETSQITARMASVPGASITAARLADAVELLANEPDGGAAVTAALLGLAAARARR